MSDLRWALSSDQQIPFQDDKAIELWFKVLKWFKPDVVDYLGDTSDQFCFARYSEGGTKEFLNKVKDEKIDLMKLVQKEENDTKKFYAKTRRMLKNAELFVALGNHDIRIWPYVDKKAPEILDQITPENLWGLDSMGYDYIYYDDVPRERYGGFYVHHGIFVSKNAGESVRKDIDDLGVSLIRGHSHRLASYRKTYQLRNETLRGYELGHMCKVDSEGFKYSQIHNWQQGFGLGLIHNGAAHIELVEIMPDYSCWAAGKYFSV